EHRRINMKWKEKLTILSVALCSSASVVHTETITLKNGTVLKGSIVQMTELDVTIDTADMGQVLVKRRTIQSINDNVQVSDVPVASPAAAPVSAQPGSLVNINNNNNNNLNNTPASSTVTSVPPAASDPAAVVSIATGPSDSATMLSGSIAAGWGGIDFSHGTADNKKVKGPSIHWEVINYRFSSGLRIGLLGEGLQSSSKSGERDTFLMGGGTIGWQSPPPQPGTSGSVAYAGLNFSYAQLNMQRNIEGKKRLSVSSYTYNSDYQQVSQNTVEEETPLETNATTRFAGKAAGLNLGYAYLFSGGAGLQMGLSAQKAWLNKVKGSCPTSEWEYSRSGDFSRPTEVRSTQYDYIECEEDPLTINTAQIYAVLSYRF
ncbi:MAG: hypothetical protein NTV34_20095, partial [Proteobacteria bacterium]|nr:hypothetical protein [Pseudomonadota bacterium]